MRAQPIQIKVTNRRSAAGKVLREAVLVAVVGAVFAVAANRISPRGLSLARNYFPAGTNTMARAAAVAGTNAAAPAATLPLAGQMEQKGLQLVDGHQAVQLFHKSHLQQGTVVFVDAREEADYQAGHIPGAYELDPYHPEKYFPAVMPVCRAAEQIVVYCNGGDCDDSRTAALLLRDVGIATGKLFVYAGGITEWTNYHQPLEIGARNSGNVNISLP